MIPQPFSLDGRDGTIVYLDAQWHPVTPEQATMAKVVFDDGGTAFYFSQEPAQKRDYVRDDHGRFAAVGAPHALTTDDVDEQIAHIAGQRDYAHYGVRVDNNSSLKVGQTAPVSSDWSDDDHPKTLEGTAAVKVSDWTRVINYSGSHIVLLGSAEAHPGTDKNEIVMPDAVVLGVWKTPVWGPTKHRMRAEGLGGITRKFDAALHPRGEDGRFVEATAPRIFNRPEEIGTSSSGWPGDPVRFAWIDKETGRTSGHLLTGEPLTRESLPETLYHVTTDAPAVEASGVLLGQLGDTGLGGGQAPGVSMTSSKESAHIIQRELKRSVQIARGEANEKIFAFWARADEEEARLPKGSLQYAADQAMEAWDANQHPLKKKYVQGQGYIDEPPTPEEHERIRRSLLKDAFNSYLWARETASEKANAGKPVPLLKNPILFGRQEHLAKLKPENIQTLEIPSAQIPIGALITTGSDAFLHEVRAYSDVPLRKKKAARDYVREPAGSSKGGQFAKAGFDPAKKETWYIRSAGWNTSPEGDRPYGWAPTPEDYAPPDTSSHKVLRMPGASVWGYSHSGSSLITGESAKQMGIVGYEDMDPSQEAIKVTTRMLEAIASDAVGAEEPLYHAFENKAGTTFRPGDTMQLPLTAAAGKPETGYATRMEHESQEGAPTVFVFPKGTKMVAYGKWPTKPGQRNYEEGNAKEFGHVYSEAIVAGKFRVVKVETVYMGSQHSRQPLKEEDTPHLYGQVVYLEPLEVFDPTTKQWVPRG